MRGMAGFDPNFPGTYHIARSTVEPPAELLSSFWYSLNKWINFSFTDIGTAQFVKLLLYLRVVFLQDSAIFRSRFPDHPLFRHPRFLMPAYGAFAANVLANLDEKETDQNILIWQAMPHLGQTVVDLNGEMRAGFRQTHKMFNSRMDRVENRLADFLDGKVCKKASL